MICISISEESRRMALADMLNASRQCDLLEIRLDRFGKAPEIKEIIAAKPKPVIMSCRRVTDGGQWEGSEEERLALLRQCIISKADYVEIELDVADQIRKFPPTKRVITYTNLKETPDDITDIYAEAQTKSPDVIKLFTLARTPEEAWPLVQILGRPAVPTVVVGLGKPGVMLSILGKKIGAPWTYAALERGMEAYPGEPTVHDLEQVYHYRSISRSTRLIGVTGLDELAYANVAALNAALASLDINARCLPLPIGDMEIFGKIIDAVHLAGVIVDDSHRDAILQVATESERAAESAHTADIIIHKSDQWHGYNTVGRAALAALEAALQAKTRGDKPVTGRMVMIVGTNATGRALTHAVKKRGGIPIVASRDKDAGHAIAQAFECRHIMFEAIYSTMHDILIVCSEEKDKLPAKKGKDTAIHAGYLRPGMAVMDLSMMPRRTPLLREAESLGCVIISPREVLVNQLELQVRLIAGRDVPRKCLEDALTTAVPEDE